MGMAAAACIRDTPTPPPGYEDKIAELDAQGLLRERQRLVEEMTFLEERIGELRAVQLASDPDAEGFSEGQRRLEGLERWRDLALRKKSHVDSVLQSGAFTRHSVRYKVNPQVLRADAGAAAGADGQPPAVTAQARTEWEDLPAVKPGPEDGGKAVVHRLSHETDGDTLRVRIEYSGEAQTRLRREDDPRAVVLEVSPVARPDMPEGSVVIGPGPGPKPGPEPVSEPAMKAEASKTMAPAESAPAVTTAAPPGTPTVLGVEQGPSGKGFAARVRLDRQAAKYRYFTMQNPPRIVVDVYGVRPPGRTHKTIPVGEAQALRIRTGWHQGPGPMQSKFRMVLDTSPSYLKSFKVVSDPDGVAILLP